MFSIKKTIRQRWQRNKEEIPDTTISTDWVGYEVLIEFIKRKNILTIPGDVLEIGAFLGGGTRKLCNLLASASPDKRLWVIDVFDPTFDWTTNSQGEAMSHLYVNALARFRGKTQWEIFQENIKGCDNVTVLKSDSRVAQLGDAKLCFAFIDGNHDPKYVQSDFHLVWKHLNSGGAIAFDDYGKDLPQTTAAIDQLAAGHKSEIASFSVDEDRHLAYIIRK